jgi:phosphoribosyl-ATP pyrophosphohydrolase
MPESSVVSALMGVIHQRKACAPSEPSYVVTLMHGGLAKIGAKIVEEAAEVVEAGGEPGEAGRVHLIREVADLVFHTLVLLGYRDLDWADVESELARRFGISGIAEKQGRSTNRAEVHTPSE